MNKKIAITVIHDFFIFFLSFFIALILRLDLDYASFLMEALWIFAILFSISNIIILNYYGLYHGIWRYASMHEIISIFKSIFISTLFIIVLLFLVFRLQDIPRSFPILLFIVSLLPIFISNKLLSVITSTFFILMIFPLITIGYSVTTPFLIFGVIILITSLFIDIIFDRARKLDNSVC